MNKYKRYERYKDSGIGWIGEIPEHWGIIKLKFLSTIFKGKNPQELTDEWREEFLPYLSMEYLRNSGDTLTLYAYPEKNLVTVNNSDILILWDGSNAGEIVEGKNGILSSTMAKIVPNNIVTRYLYWFLKGIEKFFKDNTVGMGIPHVNGETLKNHLVLLPNLQDQNSIANFLDQKTAEIDGLIADKEKLIELLQEKRQAIITEAVTKGLNQNVKMKDSGIEWIGEIPEHWEIVKLKRCFKVINGKEIVNEVELDDSSGINVYGSGGVFKKTDKYLFKGESVLFGRKGTIGKPIYVNESFWTVDTMYYTKFKMNMVPKWFYYMFIIYPWEAHTTQTALPSIVGTEIENDIWAIPSYKEQCEIVKMLNKKTSEIDELIIEVSNQIVKLKEYRQSLITEVVTGKIKV
ncbi:MAG: hypothetical protein GYA02_12755 [Clostridiaceae bacterium]|jgi:type I restriction enzyme S subunit|nr:hypothetical protein [Clostridiaceae bacterium]